MCVRIFEREGEGHISLRREGQKDKKKTTPKQNQTTNQQKERKIFSRKEYRNKELYWWHQFQGNCLICIPSLTWNTNTMKLLIQNPATVCSYAANNTKEALKIIGKFSVSILNMKIEINIISIAFRTMKPIRGDIMKRHLKISNDYIISSVNNLIFASFQIHLTIMRSKASLIIIFGWYHSLWDY